MLEYFRLGTSEVHVVFDSPSTQIFNPKQFEQVRQQNSKTPQKHEHHLLMLTHQSLKGDGVSSWIVHLAREI